MPFHAHCNHVAALSVAAILSLASTVLTSTAQGQTQGQTQGQPKIDCDNAMSTVEMNACALRDFEAADRALNETYRKALAAVPEMATEKPFDARNWEDALRRSQRTWLAYRDAECKDHVPMHWTGGTGTNADVLGCMSSLTEARTKQLKERYEAP